MSQIQTSTKRAGWIIGGSLLFGAYSSFGLYYFETFGEMGVGLLFWMTAGLILGLICLACAWWLFGTLERKALLQAMTGLAFLVLASIAVGLLGKLWLAAPFDWSQMQRIGFHLLLVGLLPSIAALLLVPHNPIQPHLPSATTEPEEIEHDSPSALEIMSSSGELALKLPAERLICVEAADNYCKFHYLSDGQRKNKIIRSSMKAMEEQLQDIPHFYRCHRSFIINAIFIEKLEGPSQAHRLVLKHLEDSVPVSRSFNPQSIPQVAQLAE